MSTKLTPEQERKVLEWFGFKWIAERHYVHGPMMHGGQFYDGWWQSPNTDDESRSHYLALPPLDLNNLIKYGDAKIRPWEMLFRLDGTTAVVIWRWNVEVISSDPAEALALAFLKAMESAEGK